MNKEAIIDEAMFELATKEMMEYWDSIGELNRRMKEIDKENCYLPKNIYKLKPKDLVMFFINVFVNEDREGVILWSDFEDSFYKKRTIKKYIKQAIELNFLDIIEETSTHIQFDYKKLLTYLKGIENE